MSESVTCRSGFHGVVRLLGAFLIALGWWATVGATTPGDGGAHPPDAARPFAADTVTIGDSIVASIDVPAEQDTFYIDLTAGDTIDIALFDIDFVNALLEVYAPDSSLVAENNDYRDLSALIPGFGATATGTYSIVARSAEDRTGSYVFKVRSSGPVVATEPFNSQWQFNLSEGVISTSDTIWIYNAGSGSADWELETSGESWLTVNTTGGTLPGAPAPVGGMALAPPNSTPVIVTVNPAGLEQGDHWAYITVRAVGDPWGGDAIVSFPLRIYDGRLGQVSGGGEAGSSLHAIEMHPDGDMVWAVDSSLFRFDPGTGVLTPWIDGLSSTGYRSLNGMEFAADGSGALYVADRQDNVLHKVDSVGSRSVVFSPGEPVYDVATLPDGIVFASTNSGLWRINPDLATSIQVYSGGVCRSAEYNPLDGWVYFGEEDWLHRYDPVSEVHETVSQIGWALWGLEVGNSGVLYARNMNGPHLMMISTDGEVLETVWTPENGKGLALDDGVLYLAPHGGEIYSFGIPDGPVDPNAAYLQVDGNTFFVLPPNGSAVDIISIFTNDGSPANVSITNTTPWLTLSTNSGDTPFEVELTVDATGLSWDRFQLPLTFTSGEVVNSPLEITVDLEIVENLIGLGDVLQGEISSEGEEDSYAIMLDAGTVVDFAAFRAPGSRIQPRIELFAPDGSHYRENECFRRCWNDDDLAAAILPGIDIPVSGLWRLNVTGWDTGAYEVKVRDSGPIVGSEPSHWMPIGVLEGQGAPETGTIWIYNAGRDSADWQIETDGESWLSVSPLSGTLPAGSPAASEHALESTERALEERRAMEERRKPDLEIFTDPLNAPEGSVPVEVTVDGAGLGDGMWNADIRIHLPSDPWGGTEVLRVNMRVHSPDVELVTPEFGHGQGDIALHPYGDLVMGGDGLTRADPNTLSHYVWTHDLGHGYDFGGMVFGPGGELYLINAHQNRLWRIDPDDSFTELSGPGQMKWDVAALPDGTLYITAENTLWRRHPDGTLEFLHELGNMGGIAYNPVDGFVYFGENNWLWRLDPSTTAVEQVVQTRRFIEDLDVGRSGRIYARHWSAFTIVDGSGVILDHLTLPSDGQGVVVTEGWLYLTTWHGLHRFPVDDGPATLSDVLLSTDGPVRMTADADGQASTTITVSLNDGSSAGVGVDWSAPWLTVTPDTGSTPLALTLTADLSGYASGMHSDTLILTSAGAANSPFEVPVIVTQPSLSLGDSIAGEIAYAEEEDVYLLSLLAGDVIDVFVADPAARFEYTLDPDLYLYNPDGSELARSIDFRGSWPLRAGVQIPADGVYEIHVVGWGNLTGPYILKVRSSGPVVNTQPHSGRTIPAMEGGAAVSDTFWVFNAGLGTTGWSVETSGESWLSVSPSSGSLPAGSPSMNAASQSVDRAGLRESEGRMEGEPEDRSATDAGIQLFSEPAQAPEGSVPVIVTVDPAGYAQGNYDGQLTFQVDDPWGGESRVNVFMRVHHPGLEFLASGFPGTAIALMWHPSGQLVMSVDGSLEFVDPETGGRTPWLQDLVDPSVELNGLALAPDRTIYAGSWTDRKLRRIWPDGSVDVVLDPGISVYAPTVLPDGTVYVGAAWALWRIDPDGYAEPVADANNRIRAAGYNPHDGWIYYSDMPDIRRYNPQTGETQFVADVGGAVYKIDVAQSGNLYLGMCCSASPNLLILNPAGETVEEVWGHFAQYGAALGPQMAYVRSGGSLYRLPVADDPVPREGWAFAWVDEAAALSGETISVPIYIDMSDVGAAIGSFQATLDFDPSVIQFQSLSQGDFQGIFDHNSANAGSGTLAIVGINTDGGANTGTTKVADILFDVVGEWGTYTDLDLTVSEIVDVEINDYSDRLDVEDGGVFVAPGWLSHAIRGDSVVRTGEAQPYALRLNLTELTADVGAFDGWLSFDPSVVVVDSVTTGSFGGTLGYNTTMQADSGFIRLAVVNPLPPTADSLDLAIVWMRGVGAEGDSTWVYLEGDELIDADLYQDLGEYVTSNDGIWLRVTTGIWGDPSLDRVISALDALICLSNVVGKDLPESFDPTMCDVVPDDGMEFTGAVTAVDALAILTYVVGKPLPEHYRVGEVR